jgi:hypothetical protein
MAIILTRCAVVHTPKTAGMWLNGALREQGLVRGILHSAGNYPHPSAAEARAALPDLPLFAFVRHPVTWLRSFWASGIKNQCKGVERIRFGPSPWAKLATCEAPTFPEFAARYLERCPGEVGRLFDRYVEGVRFVGRYETLLADLGFAFHSAGEPVDMAALIAFAPVNTGPQAELPRAMNAAICAAERGVIDRFYA